jgi:type I restriction enzyme S subunit
MSELPRGWAATTLGQLGEWSSGGTPSRKEPANFGGSIPWVKTGDLRHQLIDEVEEAITEAGLATSSAKVFPRGTLLIAMYGATIGQTGVLTIDAATNQACAALIAKGATTEIIPYVCRYIISVQDDLKAIGQGGAQPNISQTILKDFPIRIAPLPEQRRIVARIDSLSAKSSRARAHFDHIPRLVEKYKQSILAAAFRGELTRLSRSLRPVPISAMIATLDQGWSPKCEREPASEPNEWAVIKTTAIQPIHFVGGENKRLPSHLKPRPEIAIEAGDVLITRAGPRSRVAIACVVKQTRPCLMLCDKAYRLRVKQGVADPTFLALMLNAPQSLEALERIKTGISDSGLNLTQSKFLELSIPELTVGEQREIVHRIETAFTWIERLAAEAASARTLIAHLDAAVLAKAFRGELVPQSPTDEPAPALLARIMAEREAMPARPRKAGR